MNTTTISFDAFIEDFETPAFRGAILSLLRPNAPLIFHNHKENGLAYSYPLVQYKIINGNATIVLIDEGNSYVDRILSLAGKSIQISNRTLILKISSFSSTAIDLITCATLYHYKLYNWCSLNHENYHQYVQIGKMGEKRAFLEKILIGNILSMCKGTNNYIKDRIICSITSIDKIKSTTYKGVDFTTMDIEFMSNIQLPEFIGIGKHASVGLGVVSQLF